MRVKLVVVGEPSRELIDDGAGVWPGTDPGVVALQRPDEGLGHAVRLRAFDWRGAGHETDVAGEPTSVVRGIAAAIVGQPLDRFGKRVDLPEAMFDAEHHEVTNVLGADPGGCCDIAHGFTVTAVESEGDADLLAVVTGDLQPVRTPARVADVDRDPAIMPALLVAASGTLESRPCSFITR